MTASYIAPGLCTAAYWQAKAIATTGPKVVGLALSKEEAYPRSSGSGYLTLGTLWHRAIEREMGEEAREELLLAMSYAAHAEALKHLSDAGCEVLEMMEYTSRNSGLSIADAYVETNATASLSERDEDIIKA